MRKRLLALVTVLLLTAACDGAKNCTRINIGSNNSLECSGSYATMTERQIVYMDFDDEFILASSARTTVTVSVATGSVSVSYQTADGGLAMGQASVGASLVLMQDARLSGSDGSLYINLEPIGGEATEVQFRVRLEL